MQPNFPIFLKTAYPREGNAFYMKGMLVVYHVEKRYVDMAAESNKSLPEIACQYGEPLYYKNEGKWYLSPDIFTHGFHEVNNAPVVNVLEDLPLSE